MLSRAFPSSTSQNDCPFPTCFFHRHATIPSELARRNCPVGVNRHQSESRLTLSLEPDTTRSVILRTCF